MQQRTLLRIGGAVVTAIGTAAGVVASNPALITAALPPHAASVVSLAAVLILGVLHQLAHTTSAPSATAPAAPAPPPQP